MRQVQISPWCQGRKHERCPGMVRIGVDRKRGCGCSCHAADRKFWSAVIARRARWHQELQVLERQQLLPDRR